MNDRPNILFIFSDDHAAHAISAYGSRVNRTPNIDRIAAEGVIFQNCFCGNSICSPSRATVLTGKHSHINGVKCWERFDGTQFTFPKRLQADGYATAIFGKWHLKSEPTGFDEWMVYPGQGHYYNPDFRTPEGTRRIEGYAPEVTTDLSLDFLERQQGRDNPFLLMCQYKAPHRTWMPGPHYHDLYEDRDIPEPDTLFDDYAHRADVLKQHKMGIAEHLRMSYDLKVPPRDKDPASVFGVGRMNASQRAAWVNAYAPRIRAFYEADLEGAALTRWKYQRYIKDYLRVVASVDDCIGRLLDYLDANGLAENTIVVYSSDQGFYLGDHGWYDKRWMFEESLRMPFVMRWPARISAGTVIDELVQNIDFAPTFLDSAGLKAPNDVQGVSFLPLVQGEPMPWRDAVYYHYYDGPGEHGVAKHYGIRTRRYKLIYFYDNDEWSLFDLENDPQEMVCVYADPDYSEVRAALTARLTDVRKHYGDTTGKQP
jgi:arylsulfatase A-like enzyme